MYAVVETGGKQYKVTKGQVIDVERLEAEPGRTIELDRVLLVSMDDKTDVGNPTVPEAKVIARVVGEEKGDKIIVFKYKPKTRYRRKTGHRQTYTRLAIEDIIPGRA
ncbi:MAG: 50S ribosomal protein L21 [Chloroflexi bacterium]|nr:50S ribosomal protein L21 [Chloroflexota bacterium]